MKYEDLPLWKKALAVSFWVIVPVLCAYLESIL